MIAVYRNVLHDFNDKLQSTRHHPRHRKPVFRAIGFFYPPSAAEPNPHRSIRRANDAYRSRRDALRMLDREEFARRQRDVSRRLTRDRLFYCLIVVERSVK